jgi:hypothetical protein
MFILILFLGILFLIAFAYAYYLSISIPIVIVGNDDLSQYLYNRLRNTGKVLYLNYGPRQRTNYIHSLNPEDKQSLSKTFGQPLSRIETLERLVTQALVNNQSIEPLSPLLDIDDELAQSVYRVNRYYDYESKELVKIGHGNVTYLENGTRTTMYYQHLILTDLHPWKYTLQLPVDGVAVDGDAWYYRSTKDSSVAIHINDKGEVDVTINGSNTAMPKDILPLVYEVINTYNDANDTNLQMIEFKDGTLTEVPRSHPLPITRANIERMSGSQSLLYWMLYVEFKFLNRHSTPIQ